MASVVYLNGSASRASQHSSRCCVSSQRSSFLSRSPALGAAAGLGFAIPRTRAAPPFRTDPEPALHPPRPAAPAPQARPEPSPRPPTGAPPSLPALAASGSRTSPSRPQRASSIPRRSPPCRCLDRRSPGSHSRPGSPSRENGSGIPREVDQPSTVCSKSTGVEAKTPLCSPPTRGFPLWNPSSRGATTVGRASDGPDAESPSPLPSPTFWKPGRDRGFRLPRVPRAPV